MRQIEHDTTQDNQSDAPDDEGNAADVLNEKLTDAMTPGFVVDFDPDEAERAGAFTEDALSEADSLESSVDFVDVE